MSALLMKVLAVLALVLLQASSCFLILSCPLQTQQQERYLLRQRMARYNTELGRFVSIDLQQKILVVHQVIANDVNGRASSKKFVPICNAFMLTGVQAFNHLHLFQIINQSKNQSINQSISYLQDSENIGVLMIASTTNFLSNGFVRANTRAKRTSEEACHEWRGWHYRKRHLFSLKSTIKVEIESD